MTKLKAKPPSSEAARLKCLLYGEAGVGKTWAAIGMPKPYIIDTERSSAHYAERITAGGGVVLETLDMQEIIDQVSALLTERHSYLTLVIDSFTPVYEAALDDAEKKVGSEFGRHYGEANKSCKRLFRLLSMLDMHVIVTSHSKNEYGDGMKVMGQVHDGWKKLPYLFDLSLYLTREGALRYAKVVKTRFEAFPDQSRFEWSIEELARRVGDKWEAAVKPVEMATPEQVARMEELVKELSLPAETVEKLWTKAGVDGFKDMTAEQIAQAVVFYENKLRALVPAQED